MQVKDVTKRFGAVEALRGVSFAVEEGSFLTLFGPNGAGKTTLIKILSTLTKPTSGSVSVAGIDLSDDPQSVRAAIGVISHDPFLYGALTAFENIKFFAIMYGMDNVEDRALEAIKRVGLGHRMYDMVRTFSRGMQQRLAVARATVHEPQALLLDEPYTGLDQHGAHMFTDMLNGLKSQRRTVIMTTHNITEGLGISDSAAIMNGGKIEYFESSDKISAEEFKEKYMSIVGI